MGLDNGGSHISDPVNLARAKVERLRYELAQAEQELAGLSPGEPYRQGYPETYARQGR